jgi:hypothetical protein
MLVVLARPAIAAPSNVPAPPALLGMLVRAGGGVHDFKTITLLEVLAGSAAAEDLADLVRRVGAPAVKRCVADVDFMVADAQRLAPLVEPAAQDVVDGRDLARSLYASGIAVPGGSFHAIRMFAHMTSPATAARILRDAQARDGVASVMTCGDMIGTVMHAIAVSDVSLMPRVQRESEPRPSTWLAFANLRGVVVSG